MIQSTIRDLYVVGSKCSLGFVSFDEVGMIEFARRFDPQPFHVDPIAASNTSVRGLIASGWHTVSETMRLLATGCPFGITPILGIGVDDLRWPTPVRSGDRLEGFATILDARPSATKPNRGTVTLLVELFNQREEKVLSMKPMMVVSGR